MRASQTDFDAYDCLLMQRDADDGCPNPANEPDDDADDDLYPTVA